MRIFLFVTIFMVSSLARGQYDDWPELFVVAEDVISSEQSSCPRGYSGGCCWDAYGAYHDPSKGLMFWNWWTSPVSLDTVCTRGLYVSMWQQCIWDQAMHFAYYNSLNGNLVYAKLTRSRDSVSVERVIVDSIGDVGRYTSIAGSWCDWTDSTVNITYYDNTNRDLKFARFMPGQGWAVSIVDSVGDVGRYSNCALDNHDILHVSYYDATNRDLKYARYDDGNWEISVVDSIGDVGMYSSIDVENEYLLDWYDGPVIAYCDATHGDLKAAIWDSAGSWLVQRVDSTGDVGRYCSLTLNYISTWQGAYDGGGMISYYDATNASLKFARKDSCDSWYSYVVDSDEGAGLYTSIYGNNPTYVVSYYCISDSTIRVAFHGEGGAVEEASNEQLSTGNGQLSIHPNPATTRSGVRFCLSSFDSRFSSPPPPDQQGGRAGLNIYDLGGRLVRSLQISKSPNHRVSKWYWDGTDETGARVPAGVYFVKLKIEPSHNLRQALSPIRYRSARKIILVR